MKVLLFGANGMLGSSLRKCFCGKPDIFLFTAARCDADFCLDFCDDIKVRECFEKTAPDVVVNCAAIVSLPECESNILGAYLVNARFVSVISALCSEYKSTLVQISTDHYYSGDTDRRHGEGERLRFFNEYARTKFCGEHFALQYEDSLVIRTNIVGFRGKPDKPTFLEWALSSLKNGEQIKLFTDFYTSSIHTVQFAEILYNLIKCDARGLFNVASGDVFSKKQFILELSKSLFNRSPPFLDASVKSLGTHRAESLGLDCSRTEKLLGCKMPGLHSVIESIKKEYENL